MVWIAWRRRPTGTRNTRAGNTYKYKVKVTNRSSRHVAEMVSVRIVVKANACN